jgi:prefoldin subunit 5
MLQKDRKIRNLTTSVTLLKNFLFFVNNKAIKGLRTSNEELKKEVESFQRTHISDLETQKTSILSQIRSSSKCIPSEALQSQLSFAHSEITSLKSTIETLKTSHAEAIETHKQDFSKRIEA